MNLHVQRISKNNNKTFKEGNIKFLVTRKIHVHVKLIIMHLHVYN